MLFLPLSTHIRATNSSSRHHQITRLHLSRDNSKIPLASNPSDCQIFVTFIMSIRDRKKSQKLDHTGRNIGYIHLPGPAVALLFGRDINKPVEKRRREQFTREALLMELLAAEESDKLPDDGALSGSGEYED
ncbi:hypothetical protein B0H13DRAFT_2532577 [Mycena leptocephala]|nr:hypothetical protein B0H13DRAFT_2532577 [Mycena leptocephala]